MGSVTPFYAFPYPVGTDRVTDGDNAMQALAEKVEAVLKGTAPAGRVWTAARGGAPASTPGATWTGLVLVTCTGCPSGATVVVFGSINLQAVTAGGQVQARLTPTGGTIAPAGIALANQSAANYWNNLAVFGVLSATAAAPVVSLEGYVNSGNLGYDGGAHLVAVRII